MANADFDATVKKEKIKKIKKRIVAFFVVAVIVVLGLFVCSENLFFVKKMDVKIDTEHEYTSFENPYTDDEMLKGLGIEKGIGLYSFDAKQAENNAKYNLPYINHIKISRRWPSTVVARIKLEMPTYYISVENNLYILSDNLKVLEKTKDFEKIELGSLILLECDTIHSCIVGEKLGIHKDTEDIIYELDEKLCEFEVKKDISRINVSDKFNISIMYKTRYEVLLGDSKSIGTKIEFMKRIIEDRADDVSGGIIDVSDEESREAVYKKFV